MRGQCVAPAARAFVAYKRLESIAIILEADPSLEALRSGQFAGTLLLRLETRRSSDEIRGMARGITDVDTIDIRPSVGAAVPRAPSESASDAAGAASGPPSSIQPSQSRFAAQVITAQPLDRQIRVRTAVLDRLLDVVGELIMAKGRLHEVTRRTEDLALTEAIDRIDAVTRELNDEVRILRMVPLGLVLDKLPRVARDVAKRGNKQTELVVVGADIEVDRSIVDAIDTPLVHMVRNAVDHGVEPEAVRKECGKPAMARIEIRAKRRRDEVVITVKDDGGGIDAAAIRVQAQARGIVTAEALAAMDDREVVYLICAAGFSTASSVSETSGRGVGMDVVKSAVEAVGGSLTIETEKGRGTTMTLHLPLTVAMIHALMVASGGTIYAVPLGMVDESLLLAPSALSRNHGRTFARWNDRLLPVQSLSRMLGFDESGPSPASNDASPGGAEKLVYVLLMGRDNDPLGVIVDECIGQEEIVVKPLGPLLGRIEGLSGATILGNGRPAFILDVPKLTRYA